MVSIERSAQSSCSSCKCILHALTQETDQNGAFLALHKILSALKRHRFEIVRRILFFNVLSLSFDLKLKTQRHLLEIIKATLCSSMAPPDPRRPYKRPAISDQQRRRELSLLRQAQNRRDAQLQARCLASSVLSLQSQTSEPVPDVEIELVAEPESQPEQESGALTKDLDVRQASKLKGAEARKWFAEQLMLPEWMIDVPDRLNHDWYIKIQNYLKCSLKMGFLC